MNYRELTDAVSQYSNKVNWFIEKYKLPSVWFDQGYDHVAIKTYSPVDYLGLTRRFKNYSGKIVERYIDGRYLATACLLGKFGIKMTIRSGQHKSEQKVQIVELMLAKPEDQSKEPPILDHAEIFMPRGLIPVRRVLTRNGIDYYPHANASHAWVSMVINGDKDELKFTDKRLLDIVGEQIGDGTTKIIHENI